MNKPGEYPISAEEIKRRTVMLGALAQNADRASYSNFLLEGRDVPTYLDRYMAIFPQPGGFEQYNVLGERINPRRLRRLYHELLTISLPDSALDANEDFIRRGLDNPGLLAGAWLISSARSELIDKGWPTAFLAVGEQKHDEQRSLVFFSTNALPPSFTWGMLRGFFERGIVRAS